MSIAVFGPFDDGAESAPGALANAVDALRRAFPRGRFVPEDHPRQWRATIVFPRPLTAGAMRQRLAVVDPGAIDLAGGRLTIAAVTTKGEYLGLSKAFADPAAVLIVALDELLDGAQRYRVRTEDDEEDEEDDEGDDLPPDAMAAYTRRSEAAVKGWATRRANAAKRAAGKRRKR